jgi:hypothetical protein
MILLELPFAPHESRSRNPPRNHRSAYPTLHLLLPLAGKPPFYKESTFKRARIVEKLGNTK